MNVFVFADLKFFFHQMFLECEDTPFLHGSSCFPRSYRKGLDLFKISFFDVDSMYLSYQCYGLQFCKVKVVIWRKNSVTYYDVESESVDSTSRLRIHPMKKLYWWKFNNRGPPFSFATHTSFLTLGSVYHISVNYQNPDHQQSTQINISSNSEVNKNY